MEYFEYQDEVQEKLQGLVDDYYEGKKSKDEGELKQFVTEKIIDIALDYSTDHSEEIFEKAFGKEAVKKSRIPVSTIREVYDGLNTISDAADIGSDIAGLIDAAGDLKFGNMSNTSNEYHEAMKELTDNMLSLTDTLVQNIPICGPMASMIVNELDQCFEKGYDIITNHIAQLKYVDAMCDYYTGAISTSDLVDRLSDVKGIDQQELQQYRILANTKQITNRLQTGIVLVTMFTAICPQMRKKIMVTMISGQTAAKTAKTAKAKMVTTTGRAIPQTKAKKTTTLTWMMLTIQSQSVIRLSLISAKEA